MTLPTSKYARRCELGGEDIDIRMPGIHQWTAGWVLQREGGGGHGISLAKREDRWACRYHVDEATRGQVGQKSMF